MEVQLLSCINGARGTAKFAVSAYSSEANNQLRTAKYSQMYI